MLLYPSHLETEGSGSGGWHLDAADEKAVNELFGSSSAAVFASINMLFFGVSYFSHMLCMYLDSR